MREINISKIIEVVEKLCIASNYYLNEDIKNGLKQGLDIENSPLGKNILTQLLENAEIARNQQIPLCQDTGMTVVFIEVGQDVHVSGGNITEAINEGVRRGYKNGYLRYSVVNDPILRINTNDNTPAIIHYDIVNGDKLKIIVAPKGFGSENMSAINMLKPSDGINEIKSFIVNAVDKAGSNPCPPIIVGIGIGGTIEKATILAKKSLLRPINIRNSLAHIKCLEEEILYDINNLGIGPAGLGGRVTALSVNIEVFATHIAGLPVAINISCHSTRHKEEII